METFNWVHQDIFENIEKCLERELWDSLEDACLNLHILSDDEETRLWFNKKEGWQWINTP